MEVLELVSDILNSRVRNKIQDLIIEIQCYKDLLYKLGFDSKDLEVLKKFKDDDIFDLKQDYIDKDINSCTPIDNFLENLYKDKKPKDDK